MAQELSIYREEFEQVRLNMASDDFCLFCFLLDSLEGLATHSSPAERNVLDISVAASQKADFQKFLQIWADYKSNAAVKHVKEIDSINV